MSRLGIEVRREGERIRVEVAGVRLDLSLEQADELAAELRSETFHIRREQERKAKGRRW